jgi:hypothetical protein
MFVDQLGCLHHEQTSGHNCFVNNLPLYKHYQSTTPGSHCTSFSYPTISASSDLFFAKIAPWFERTDVDVPYSNALDYLNYVGLSEMMVAYSLHLFVEYAILLTIWSAPISYSS